MVGSVHIFLCRHIFSYVCLRFRVFSLTHFLPACLLCCSYGASVRLNYAFAIHNYSNVLLYIEIMMWHHFFAGAWDSCCMSKWHHSRLKCDVLIKNYNFCTVWFSFLTKQLHTMIFCWWLQQTMNKFEDTLIERLCRHHWING
jgi:hypothetical protein